MLFLSRDFGSGGSAFAFAVSYIGAPFSVGLASSSVPWIIRPYEVLILSFASALSSAAGMSDLILALVVMMCASAALL